MYFRQLSLAIPVLAFALVLQHLPGLPGWTPIELLALGSVALCLLCGPLRRAFARRCLWICLLSTWLLVSIQQGLQGLAAQTFDRTDLVAQLKVVGLPIRDEQGWRFAGVVLSAEPAESATQVIGKTVSITWSSGYSVQDDMALPATIRPGQVWRMPLRLRSWRSQRNPILSGAPDLRLRAMEQGWWAQAQVRSNRGEAIPIAQGVSPCWNWDCWMERIDAARYATRDALLASLRQDHARVSGMLVALVLGDQSLIAAQDWVRFNRTGIGHLISISGLHVTMIAALGAWGVSAFWRICTRRSQQFSRWAERRCSLMLAGRIGAVVVGAFYCLYAGAQVPAQRTFWMLLTLALITALRRRSAVLVSLSCAAAVVLLIDPWAVSSPGFWLSFLATWVLMRGLQIQADLPKMGWRKHWQSLLLAAKAQALVTLGLIPLAATFFGTFSLVSPFANAFAIPLVSYFITPLAIAGAVLQSLEGYLGTGIFRCSDLLWHCAAILMEWMMRALAFIDTQDVLPVVVPLAAPASLLGLVSLGLALLGMILLVTARSKRARILSLCGLLLPFAPEATWPTRWPSTTRNDLTVTALDLGAGSAILVRSPDLTILYDTGSSNASSDQAARILLPYLREQGVRKLDFVVVSHADREHAGGLASVLTTLPVGNLVLPLQMHSAHARFSPQGCGSITVASATTRLEWFQWKDAKAVNDSSCVLRVSVGEVSMLLLGDLGVPGQQALTAAWPAERLRSSIVQMPGQGAKQTWHVPLLNAVAPRYAVLQSKAAHWRGYPVAASLAPLNALQVQLLRTDWHGAFTIKLDRSAADSLWRERLEAPRYFDTTPIERPAPEVKSIISKPTESKADP